MFPDLFQFGFADDHALGNAGVVRFGAERVQFAKDFLSDEFERPADRLVPAKMMRELGKMTFDTREFFRNVGSIGKKRNFFD